MFPCYSHEVAFELDQLIVLYRSSGNLSMDLDVALSFNFYSTSKEICRKCYWKAVCQCKFWTLHVLCIGICTDGQLSCSKLPLTLNQEMSLLF